VIGKNPSPFFRSHLWKKTEDWISLEADWSSVMPLPIFAVPVALHLIVAASSAVPNLDVVPSCRAAAAAQFENTNRMQACIGSEQEARGQLVKEWPTFPDADRTSCVNQIMDFDPSYIELLTCLDMAKDAEKLPKALY
jgi:hypothetical protein